MGECSMRQARNEVRKLDILTATMRDMSRTCQRDISRCRERLRAGIIPHMNEEIYQRIQAQLELLDLSERRASMEAGLGADAIRDIRRRQHTLPRLDTLIALAKPLRTSASWLAFGEGDSQSLRPQQVPIVSLVAASRFADVPAVVSTDDAPVLGVSGLPSGQYIGLRVSGDSMDRIAPDGSTVVINISDRELRPRSFYVFRQSDSATFKRYMECPARLEPFSTNPTHEAIAIDNDIDVIGRAVRVITDL